MIPKMHIKNSTDPFIRPSARVILLNPNNEVLLLKADDPKTIEKGGVYRGPFWFLVGGGLQASESLEQAALREVYEETGIGHHEMTLGPLVWLNYLDLIIDGVAKQLHQHFFVATTSQSQISFAHHEPQEQAVIKEARWFSMDELKACQEPVYPRDLTKHLPALISREYPKIPLIVN